MSAVTEYLRDRKLEYLTFGHAATWSAVEEARALGVEPGEVAKCLVLDTSSGHALAVIPASRRVDMHLVVEATGDAHARLATEVEIAEDFPGFQLGAIPPIAGLVGVQVYIDPELTRRTAIVFASGSQTESVKMRVVDLLTEEHVTIAPLTRLFDDEGPIR